LTEVEEGVDMLRIIAGYSFCGLALGYAIAVVHTSTAARHAQQAAVMAARVAERVAAIGRRGNHTERSGKTRTGKRHSSLLSANIAERRAALF
jgi:hypothetical protein